MLGLPWIGARGIRARALPVLATLALAAALGCRSVGEPVSASTAPAGSDAPLHLIVLHTNDMHGQVLPRETRSGHQVSGGGSGGLVRAIEHVERVRGEEAGPRTAVLAVDAGDWFQGTPEGMLDGGLGFVRALAAAELDGAAIGNHEFDLGLEHLIALLAETGPGLHALAANVRDPASGERVPWVAPWRVVRVFDRGAREVAQPTVAPLTVAPLTIALVGLVTDDTPRITHPDARRLRFTDPLEELDRVLAELEAAGGVDLVIPVAHVGPGEGARIAAAHPELPLVVTGHSHTYLNEGRRVGETLVVQAGEKATVVGRVDLWLDPETLAVRDSRARLDALDEPLPEGLEAGTGPAAEVARRSAELVARAEQLMGGVVGELTAPLTRGSGPGSTVAGSWVADLMRARTGADVAFHNRGGTRRDLGAGPVTRRDVFELLPFDNQLVTFTLDGATLAAVVARATGGAGALDYSGLEVRLRPAPGGGLEPVDIRVGGEPLDPARRYTVTTNSFVAQGGDGYPELERAPDRRVDPILLRELVLAAFERSPRATPPADARITVE